jgi:hypothetical protein
MKSLSVIFVLLALGGAADAKTQVVSLDGHCDVLTLKINKTNVVGADDPNCATGMGIGYVGKVKGFGTAVVAGVQFSAVPGAQFVMRLSYPLVTGGSWDLSLTTDGSTFTPYESGTYTIEGTAAKGPRGTVPVVAGTLTKVVAAWTR